MRPRPVRRSLALAGLVALAPLALLAGISLPGCGEPPPADGAPDATAALPSGATPPLATAPGLPPAATPPSPDAPLAAVGAFSAREGEVLSDVWYDTRRDGRKDGWYHMVWRRATYEGHPSIHDRTEHVTASTRVMGGVEDVFESRSVSDLHRTDDGMLLAIRTVSEIADRSEVTEVRFEKDRYVRTSRVAGLEQRDEVPAASPLPVDTEAFLAPLVRSGALAPGKTFSYGAANYTAKRIETVELTVEAEETIATPVGRIRCWRVTESVAGRPGTSVWWLDGNGVLCRVRTGAQVVERTTPEKARNLDPSAAAYTITLPAQPELPRCTSAARSVVSVSIGPSEDELPVFPTTPFSRVLSADGRTFRLELTAHDAPDANTAYPVSDPALATWLASSNLYAPQHELVREALREALGPSPDAADARTAVRRILRYVFQRLRKGSGPIPQPTAVEILRENLGDCSEHAVLFVALCRSAGIPARRLSGYAQVGDMWGSHAFCEVWLGRWVGADPTTNELGTAARYVAFGWDEDPDSFPGIVSSRCQGKISIRTLSVTEDGVTDELAGPPRRTTADAVLDVRSGIAHAPLPEGWSAFWDDASLRLSGPGVTADVRVQWGMGDLDVALLSGSRMTTGPATTFAGHPALRQRSGRASRAVATHVVPWKRRTIVVSVRRTSDAADDAEATVERLLAPTFR